MRFRKKPVVIEAIQYCSSCGEPVNDGYVLCAQCVNEVNRRAKTTMEVVIEALGLGKRES